MMKYEDYKAMAGVGGLYPPQETNQSGAHQQQEMMKFDNYEKAMSGNVKTWNDIKNNGSDHYKSGGGSEPIDLIKDLGLLRQFALANIIKYASRNAKKVGVRIKDMDKIIHCAEMLKAAYGGEE